MVKKNKKKTKGKKKAKMKKYPKKVQGQTGNDASDQNQLSGLQQGKDLYSNF